jgi:hypothetical protein
MRRVVAAGAVLLLAGTAAGTVAGCRTQAVRSASSRASGWVLFQLADRSVHMVAAVPHGLVLDLSGKLGATGPATLSRNAAWVALTTSDGCAAVSGGELDRLEKVTANGRCVAAYAESTHVSDRGDELVFTAGSDVHRRDVFLTHRDGPDRWTEPRNLTGSGPYAVNKLPVLSPDGGEVVFDCSDGDASDEGTNVCRAPTSGGAVTTVLKAPLGDGGPGWTAFHSPAYLPGGGYAFECHHPHEELVCTLPAGAEQPVRYTAAGVSNDNSPCAFADGAIASLLDTGTHTIRVAKPDGSGAFTAYDREDVLDAGIYCGGP